MLYRSYRSNAPININAQITTTIHAILRFLRSSSDGHSSRQFLCADSTPAPKISMSCQCARITSELAFSSLISVPSSFEFLPSICTFIMSNVRERSTLEAQTSALSLRRTARTASEKQPEPSVSFSTFNKDFDQGLIAIRLISN